MDKEFIYNLYHHDCECCPYETEQKDEEGNIVLDCSYETEKKEKWKLVLLVVTVIEKVIIEVLGFMVLRSSFQIYSPVLNVNW